MSSHHTTVITCPACGKESDFRIWDSINTGLDPEMKKAVLDFSAFKFTCPHCGAETNVDYGFLYHQMEDKVMIHYASTDENAAEMYETYTGKKFPEMFEGFLSEKYRIRIVRSLDQLREKIRIFDTGLDDRIIEIYKVILLVRIMDQRPDLNMKSKMYFLPYEGKPYLQIFNDDGPIGGVEMDMDMYKGLEKDFGKDLPEIYKDDPVVDRDWGLSFLQSQKSN